MIQANEIRIGNLFTANGFPMHVEAIFKDTIYFDFEGEENIKDLVPIPLTEEILIKAGFHTRFGTDPQEPNALKVYFIEDFEILKFEDDKEIFYSQGKGVHLEVKSVHQLQNLYFALTGEEIKIPC